MSMRRIFLWMNSVLGRINFGITCIVLRRMLGVLVEDIVHYGLYGGILARGIHAALVRPQLEAIFDYRKRVLDDLFV